VPGGLQHLEAHPSKGQPLAVAQRRELVLGVRATAEVDPGTLAVAQFEMPGDEIGMKVSQEHVPDPTAQPVGVLHILINVTLRINHSGHAAPLVSHQIGGVRQTPQVVLPQDQRAPPRRNSRISTQQRRTLPPPCWTPKTLGMNRSK
jgi:hypothetical protein